MYRYNIFLTDGDSSDHTDHVWSLHHEDEPEPILKSSLRSKTIEEAKSLCQTVADKTKKSVNLVIYEPDRITYTEILFLPVFRRTKKSNLPEVVEWLNQ